MPKWAEITGFLKMKLVINHNRLCFMQSQSVVNVPTKLNALNGAYIMKPLVSGAV